MFEFFKREPLYHYPMDRFSLKSPILYRPEHRVVHVGGGPRRNHPSELNLNLFPMTNVDIVGSAERLPFADESVDVLISNAVLEHVRDLPAVLAEMNRVLKPGGYVYIEIPFIQHYHTHDGHGVQFEDYRRFTKAGLTQAFEFCTPIDVGACVGPTSTVVQMLYGLASDLGRSPRYQRAVERAYYAAGNLVVWIDGVLSDETIQDSKIPSGVYYFGRKPDAASQWLANLPRPHSAFPRDVSGKIRLSGRSADRLDLSVTNTSRTTWLKGSRLPWGAVHVGLQPLRAGDIAPGQAFTLRVELQELRVVRELTIDLVIEGLCWFSDHGSRPLRVRL